MAQYNSTGDPYWFQDYNPTPVIQPYRYNQTTAQPYHHPEVYIDASAHTTPQLPQEIILVFYLNVGNMDVNDVNEYTERQKQTLLRDKPEHHRYFFIPVRNQETRVECLPTVTTITEDQQQRITNILSELENMVDGRNKHLEINKPKPFKIRKSRI